MHMQMHTRIENKASKSDKCHGGYSLQRHKYAGKCIRNHDRCGAFPMKFMKTKSTVHMPRKGAAEEGTHEYYRVATDRAMLSEKL